jgi:GDP-4-dehydro-6-deoxy-D-mannose reductase
MQYYRAFGSRVVLSRSFSHTGPGQRETFVLPSFARQCARIKAGLDAPEIRTGDTGVTRDFLDVRDVVRAYRLLMEKGEEGRTYNVSSGEGLVLGEALAMLMAAAGIEARVTRDPALERPADVRVLVGDNARLRADTGWKREISAERMLDDLYGWWSGAVDSGTRERG